MVSSASAFSTPRGKGRVSLNQEGERYEFYLKTTRLEMLGKPERGAIRAI